MEFHEWIYDNLGYDSLEEYLGDCIYACEEIFDDESPEAFLNRISLQGRLDWEFFYNYLCYVSERAELSDADREEFVTTYFVAFDDFYGLFHSETSFLMNRYLEFYNYSEYSIDTVLEYADSYCSTLLDVYMEKHMAPTLPPSPSEEPAVTLEPVETPEPSVTPEPVETPEPAVTLEPVQTSGTVTPAGVETELPYDSNLLLQEVHKTNMLLSVIIFVLLASWLVGKARNIVGGMTNDGKTG